MAGKRLHEPSEDATTVPSSVQGKFGPEVGIALLRPSREVRRVREDPVEASEPPKEVSPEDLDIEVLGTGGLPHSPEGRRVHVGRHDTGSMARGGERRETRSGTHVGEQRSRGDLREREQEVRVLPRKINVHCLHLAYRS